MDEFLIGFDYGFRFAPLAAILLGMFAGLCFEVLQCLKKARKI